MVEFDVQLSKDLIPVIYHDFYVSISLKRKKQIEAMDMLDIPVKDLTLEQLHLLKVCKTSNSISNLNCNFKPEINKWKLKVNWLQYYHSKTSHNVNFWHQLFFIIEDVKNIV